MEVVRRITMFQGSFPPLKELRRELTPISEMPVKAELLGGALILSGRIDLVLGAPDRLEPTRATRLAIDLKTGNAYPEYPEDLRYYALLLTLRFGVPPYRVASLFLESGEWQAEDVGELALHHAADRVIAAARAAAALWNGREPELTPGVYCGVVPTRRGLSRSLRSHPDSGVPRDPSGVEYPSQGRQRISNGGIRWVPSHEGSGSRRPAGGSSSRIGSCWCFPSSRSSARSSSWSVFGLGMLGIGLPGAGRVAEPRHLRPRLRACTWRSRSSRSSSTPR